MTAILDWTGGQPFLTHKLCKIVFENANLIANFISPEVWIGNLVQSRFIENWEATDEPPHLKTIRDRILRGRHRIRALLDLYQQILQHGEIAADESSEQMELRLSGLVIKQQGKLKVCNRIYKFVFNSNWLNNVLTNLQADFLQVVTSQEQKLLSMLSVMEGKDFDDILYEILGSITLKMTELLSVDRTIFYQFFCKINKSFYCKSNSRSNHY